MLFRSADLEERNKEIYLSSAWFKSHWSFEKVQAFAANLVDDTKRYFICGLPYQLSIREHLLSKEQVADEMSEADFNEISWSVEMDALFYSDTEGSLFSHEDIAKNRQLKNAICPPNITDAFSHLKRPTGRGARARPAHKKKPRVTRLLPACGAWMVCAACRG